MSRSGYSDDCDNDWSFIMWRGAVRSALNGRRGQAFLKEMLAAMDGLPVKRLLKNELEAPDLVPCSHWGEFETSSVCAIGAVGKARGINMSEIDPEDYSTVAEKFGIATAMAQEIVWVNDEGGIYRETSEARFDRVHRWIVSQIREAVGTMKTEETT